MKKYKKKNNIIVLEGWDGMNALNPMVYINKFCLLVCLFVFLFVCLNELRV